MGISIPMSEMEDRALDRLLARLDVALMMIASDDPSVEWRTS